MRRIKWVFFMICAITMSYLVSMFLGTTGAASNTGTIKGTVKVLRSRNSADAVVYLERIGDNTFAPPEKHAMIDQKNLRFIPHVLPILKGTTVDFPNSDNVRHNVLSPPGTAKQFNLGTYDVGVTKSVTFEEEGEVPLLCNVHTEMSAFIVVLPNPYFAVTDRRGNFSIEGVPPGTYTLETWHERMRSVSQEVTVETKTTAEVQLTLKKRR